jgi:hypothetical protein
MMYPHADRDSLANYFLASQELQRERRERPRPISVDEQLPAFQNPDAEYKSSVNVFAYDTECGWTEAMYKEANGACYWEAYSSLIGGYECESERLYNVTHWIADFPPPDEW